MACHLVSAKPLSKPMLEYFLIGPLGTIYIYIYHGGANNCASCGNCMNNIYRIMWFVFILVHADTKILRAFLKLFKMFLKINVQESWRAGEGGSVIVEIHTFSLKNPFHNVIWKMAAILYWPKCVKSSEFLWLSMFFCTMFVYLMMRLRYQEIL